MKKYKIIIDNITSFSGVIYLKGELVTEENLGTKSFCKKLMDNKFIEEVKESKSTNSKK